MNKIKIIICILLLSSAATGVAQSQVFLYALSGKGNSESTAPYLVYTALLTQTGTDAPVATVLQNTLGQAVVWSRQDMGHYIATTVGAFTEDKTADFVGNVSRNTIEEARLFTVQLSDMNEIRLRTMDADGVTLSDAYLNKTSFEIRVYPTP